MLQKFVEVERLNSRGKPEFRHVYVKGISYEDVIVKSVALVKEHDKKSRSKYYPKSYKASTDLIST